MILNRKEWDMKRLIEFPLEDGSTVVIEVDEPEFEGSLIKAARPGEVVIKAQQTFEHAIDKIKPGADVIIKQLRNLSDSPDEIKVFFGLKLSAEAGAVVAAAGIDANYSITLKWKKKE
jgi:hypothetical protein